MTEGVRRRRVDGAGGSETRDALVRATAQIMLEEGYAAATSRRVAARAGIRPPLVHYYFPTMDDLYLAVFRDGAEANLERLKQALLEEQPMRAILQLHSDPKGTALQMEFMALSNHRKAIRSEIAAYGLRFREIETAAFAMLMGARGIDPRDLPPVAVSVALTCVTRTLVMESELGITGGHDRTQRVLDDLVQQLELRPPATGTDRGQTHPSHSTPTT